jgi:hypothetical protein
MGAVLDLAASFSPRIFIGRVLGYWPPTVLAKPCTPSFSFWPTSKKDQRYNVIDNGRKFCAVPTSR